MAEGHRRQIAPGSGVVRSRGGMGWPSLRAGRASVATPWDPAGSRRDRHTGLLGRECLPH